MPRGRPKSAVKVGPENRHLAKMRVYLKRNPECTFEEMKKGLGIAGVSKPWFLYVKGEMLRNQTERFNKAPPSLYKKSGAYMKVQILETVDISNFSSDLKEHYRSYVLPMLKRLYPDGPTIHFAFLSDPPCIEIRKMVG